MYFKRVQEAPMKITWQDLHKSLINLASAIGRGEAGWSLT